MTEIVYLDTERDRQRLAGASCAFGVFDGVHTGHRFLIDEAREFAYGAGADTVVLTFDIDPDELFHPDRLHKLLSNEDRLAMLAETGVDAVCVLRFNREFASQLPEAFLAATFGEALPAALHVGYDIRFGSRASGTLATLEEWGAAHGVAVFGHDLLTSDGAPITATRIRLLLEAGDELEAHRLLGR